MSRKRTKSKGGQRRWTMSANGKTEDQHQPNSPKQWVLAFLFAYLMFIFITLLRGPLFHFLRLPFSPSLTRSLLTRWTTLETFVAVPQPKDKAAWRARCLRPTLGGLPDYLDEDDDFARSVLLFFESTQRPQVDGTLSWSTQETARTRGLRVG